MIFKFETVVLKKPCRRLHKGLLFFKIDFPLFPRYFLPYCLQLPPAQGHKCHKSLLIEVAFHLSHTIKCSELLSVMYSLLTDALKRYMFSWASSRVSTQLSPQNWNEVSIFLRHNMQCALINVSLFLTLSGCNRTAFSCHRESQPSSFQSFPKTCQGGG